jgi:L-amino acid N-acyltransferase YncA
VKIRDAVEEDLPAIVEIYNSTVPSRMVTADPEPVSVESRFAWFREHDPKSRPIWVVEMDGRIVGWLSFEDFRKR